MSNKVKTPSGTIFHYIGPHQSEGPLPALIYFSLSGEESLQLPPYNHPAEALAKENMRTFSLTLPGHEEGQNKHHAMRYWAEQIASGRYLLEEFVDQVAEGVEWLIHEGMIDPLHMAAAGLSRGGLVAGLLAAKNSHIKTLVGFAPVVDLAVLSDFSEMGRDPRFLDRLAQVSLFSKIEKLTHLEHLRFYISTRDERVNTDRCYQFIRALSEKVHEKRIRHCHVELYLTSPLGHMGHGTAPSIFDEGSALLKRKLVI